MKTTVKRWGNSQGIRLSKELLDQSGFNIDDELEVDVSKGMIVLVKPFRHQTLEERASKYGGHLNLDGEGDWIRPEGREVWE